MCNHHHQGWHTFSPACLAYALIPYLYHPSCPKCEKILEFDEWTLNKDNAARAPHLHHWNCFLRFQNHGPIKGASMFESISKMKVKIRNSNLRTIFCVFEGKRNRYLLGFIFDQKFNKCLELVISINVNGIFLPVANAKGYEYMKYEGCKHKTYTFLGGTNTLILKRRGNVTGVYLIWPCFSRRAERNAT